MGEAVRARGDFGLSRRRFVDRLPRGGRSPSAAADPSTARAYPVPRYGLPPASSPSGSPYPPGALHSARAFLRGGLRADGTYEGVGEWDVPAYQWDRLESWARGQALILPVGFTPEREGGREHDVRFVAGSRRWFKFTKPNAAGYFVELIGSRLEMLPASPLQYLERWRVANRLFFDDVRLEGVWSEGATRRIVVSQPDIVGEEPTWEEVERAMWEDYGLRRLPGDDALGGYEARAYFRGRFGVFDVRPVNCVRTADGEVVPIDVIPRVFGRADAQTVARIAG